MGKKQTWDKRARDLWKEQPGKNREFFPSFLSLPEKGRDLGKDRRTSWENGKRCFGKAKGRERDLEKEGKGDTERERKLGKVRNRKS